MIPIPTANAILDVISRGDVEYTDEVKSCYIYTYNHGYSLASCFCSTPCFICGYYLLLTASDCLAAINCDIYDVWRLRIRISTSKTDRPGFCDRSTPCRYTITEVVATYQQLQRNKNTAKTTLYVSTILTHTAEI